MRLWTVCKEAGRGWPELDTDDVIDFMVMEAVAVKVAKEREKAEQNKKADEFKHDKAGLDRLRDIAG